jgi:hypothetical protein
MNEQNGKIFQDFVEAVSSTLIECQKTTLRDFYITAMASVKNLPKNGISQIYTERVAQDGAFKLLIQQNVLDVQRNGNAMLVDSLVEKFNLIDDYIQQFEEPLRGYLQTYRNEILDIRNLILQSDAETDLTKRAELLAAISRKIRGLTRQIHIINNVIRSIYPSMSKIDLRGRGRAFDIFVLLSEVLPDAPQDNPEYSNALGEHTLNLTNIIMSDKAALAYMSDLARNIFYNSILPAAIAYALQTNPEFHSALNTLAEQKAVSQNLTYELSIVRVIQELSSKIADFIREKTAEEQREVLLQEKRAEDNKYTLNINDAIKQYLASIGLDIENIAVAAIDRYRDAAGMG